MSKEVTLADLFDDPENQALFNMHNMEKYKGYSIYEENDSTLATKLVNGGVQVYSLKSIGNLTRQALRSKIDTL